MGPTLSSMERLSISSRGKMLSSRLYASTSASKKNQNQPKKDSFSFVVFSFMFISSLLFCVVNLNVKVNAKPKFPLCI